MNLIIFGGFLGSGKTSLILSLAHHIIDKSVIIDKPKLVIIENEIGETGIDDKILKSGGYSVKELFAGCICCTLSVDLTTTINDIYRNINPEWIIIECTGIAYPGMVMDSLKKYTQGIDMIKVVTVVDAERMEELTDITPVLVEKQVKDGDVVLINKIDLISEEELKKAEEHVAEINSNAKIYKVSANQDIVKGLWNEVTG
ncbi:putative GTP-binding protein YjiA [Oxobacter pfennigii]|uniref:Putative GTP-binding protein YjiA n=1 Tax=Oxobacter pfennigii TaxID=36849 RepID=A0A0P8YS64_9CLOT|nr:GTP-binding protein [Oxobacter pfennigii]KPU42487.1 putative GTP-binding protein YjiA [Oxobacter pfennigii]